MNYCINVTYSKDIKLWHAVDVYDGALIFEDELYKTTTQLANFAIIRLENDCELLRNAKESGELNIIEDILND